MRALASPGYVDVQNNGLHAPTHYLCIHQDFLGYAFGQ